MSEFLLELYSEEIPAGLQKKAEQDLERLMKDILAEYNVKAETVVTYSAPQRIAILMDGLPTQISAQVEEKKGPRIEAPQQAIDGFLKSNDLNSVDELSIQKHKKGDFYLLKIEKPAQNFGEIFQTAIPEMIKKFPWKKSMRWGNTSLRWVRPLRSILCRFDSKVVPFKIENISSTGVSYGHRFMSPKDIEIVKNADYLPTLEKAKVIASAQKRQEMIEAQIKGLLTDDIELVDDKALLEEVSGLVEYPNCLRGRIDESFMEIPDEVLIQSMRSHQKYFSLKDKKTQKLAPYFITVSNMTTDDEGTKIIAGNERVLSARLSDAKFFYEEDKKQSLESLIPELDKITFHKKIGSVGDKVKRMQKWIETTHEFFESDKDVCLEAVKLCKADLVTNMVKEFPSLQGIMGGYYTKNKDVAVAITEHYKPIGIDDKIPSTREGAVVALADKLDTLVEFWKIDEKPTGSKDPYALRRAALGVISILVQIFPETSLQNLIYDEDLQKFIFERLKFYLKNKENIDYDIVMAVLETKNDFIPIAQIVNSARHLNDFLQKDEGKELYKAYKRAKGLSGDLTDMKPGLFSEEDKKFEAALKNHDGRWESFSEPVHDFLNNCRIEVEDEAITKNRKALLAQFCTTIEFNADFSKLEKRS